MLKKIETQKCEKNSFTLTVTDCNTLIHISSVFASANGLLNTYKSLYSMYFKYPNQFIYLLIFFCFSFLFQPSFSVSADKEKRTVTRINMVQAFFCSLEKARIILLWCHLYFKNFGIPTKHAYIYTYSNLIQIWKIHVKSNAW